MKNLLLIAGCWLGLAAFAPAQFSPELDARVLEYLGQKDVAPITARPGARLQKDFDEAWLRWAERAIVEPFAKLAAVQWPAREKEAAAFVREALRFWKTGNHPALPPEALVQKGRALSREKVDDPLVLMLTAWIEASLAQRWPAPLGEFDRAARHGRLKAHPPSTRALIIGALHRFQTENRANLKLVKERVEAARLTLADDQTYQPDEEEILISNVEFLFEWDIFKEAEPEVEALCALPQSSPWVRTCLDGFLEEARGWRHDQKAHLPTARELLVKAWEMHPDRPQCAAHLIKLAREKFVQGEESTRLWFDRAVAAQFDYMPAYTWMMYASRPRWSGSAGNMAAFGLACAQTGRYDTAIPAQMFEVMKQVVSELDDWRPLYRSSIFSSALREVTQHMVREPRQPWLLPALKAQAAIYAWAAGDYARADGLLRETPSPFPPMARRLTSIFDMSERQIRSEAAIYAAGRGQAWEACEKAYQVMRLDDAEKGLRDLAATFGTEVPEAITSRLAAIASEKQLGAGNWVPMAAPVGLSQWTNNKGSWEGTPEGDLLLHGDGESAFIYFDPRIGTNLEIRGEYEVSSGKTDDLFLGVALGHGHTGSAEHWMTCMQFPDAGDKLRVTLLDHFTKSDVPYTSFEHREPRCTFHITCKDGRLTYRINDREILKDIDVSRSSEFDMVEDGRVGFCSYFFEKGVTTRIRKAEVRRLEP